MIAGIVSEPATTTASARCCPGRDRRGELRSHYSEMYSLLTRQMSLAARIFPYRRSTSCRDFVCRRPHFDPSQGPIPALPFVAGLQVLPPDVSGGRRYRGRFRWSRSSESGRSGHAQENGDRSGHRFGARHAQDLSKAIPGARLRIVGPLWRGRTRKDDELDDEPDEQSAHVDPARQSTGQEVGATGCGPLVGGCDGAVLIGVVNREGDWFATAETRRSGRCECYSRVKVSVCQCQY